jgi:hypothetical protein
VISDFSKGGYIMLGFGDIWVAAAYLLSILSTLLCVIYGLKHWNDEEQMPPIVHPPDEDTSIDDKI